MTKRMVARIITILLFLTLTGCSEYTQEDIDAAQQRGYENGHFDGYNEGHRIGYDEGFSQGQEAGQQGVLDNLRDYDLVRMEEVIEELESLYDYIYEQYGINLLE